MPDNKEIFEITLTVAMNGDFGSIRDIDLAVAIQYAVITASASEIETILGAAGSKLESILRSTDEDGNTPVLRSLIYNEEDNANTIACFKVLFDSKIDLSSVLGVPNNTGAHIIQYITGYNKHELFADIVREAKARHRYKDLLEVVDDKGRTLLHWAAIDNADEINEAVLNDIKDEAVSPSSMLLSDNIDRLSFHCAVEVQNERQIRKFNEVVSNRGLKDIFFHKDQEGNTLLTSALVLKSEALLTEVGLIELVLDGLLKIVKDGEDLIANLKLENTAGASAIGFLIDDTCHIEVSHLFSQVAKKDKDVLKTIIAMPMTASSGGTISLEQFAIEVGANKIAQIINTYAQSINLPNATEPNAHVSPSGAYVYQYYDTKVTVPATTEETLYWYNEELTYRKNYEAAIEIVDTKPQEAWKMVFEKVLKGAPCKKAGKENYCLSGIWSPKDQRDVTKVKPYLAAFKAGSDKYLSADKASILSKFNNNTDSIKVALKDFCLDSANSGDYKHDTLCGSDGNTNIVEQHVIGLVDTMFSAVSTS